MLPRLVLLVIVVLVLPLSSCRRAAEEQPAGGSATTRPSEAPAAAQPLPQEQFFEAALNGELEKVRDGLARGNSAVQADQDGRTALMLAAYNGHTAIVRLLAEAGATIDARDRTGRTALMYACSGPNDETATFLLGRKAGVNLADSNEHWTPIMFAAAEGHGGIVRMLLAAGADPHAADVDGEDAELFARTRGFLELADTLAAAKRRK